MAYSRINWQNEPSEATALNDVNLNKMDSAIYELDGKATTTETAITALQDGKVDKVSGKGLSELSKLTITPDTTEGKFVASIKMYDAEGAQTSVYLRNGVTVDSALSNSSTNPVQNKVVKSAIDEKSTVAISDTLETGTTLANITIDGTTTAIKGSDIEVDDELSPTSTNPVQNKVVKSALDGKVDKESGKGLSTISAIGVTASATSGDTIADIIAIDQSGNTYHNYIKNGVVVDSAISTSSENPVQNKVISEAFRDILPEETAEGNPITITDGSDIVPAKSAELTLNPIQDLHGYDNPWVGGAGKNKVDGDTLFSGYKIASNSYEATNSQIVNTKLYLGDYVGKTITFSLNFTSVSGVNRAFVQGNIDGSSVNGNAVTSSGISKVTVTPTSNSDFIHITYGSITGTLNFKWNNVQLEIGSTATEYAPYENICPISGRTQGEITVADAETSPTQTQTYTITFGQTIYGGKVDAVSGKLTDEWAEIASYAGETITEPWLSDRDEYTAGGTPTTGAQVVYKKATATTSFITPTDIELLKGDNVISTDCDGLKVVYSADIKAYIDKKLAE